MVVRIVTLLLCVGLVSVAHAQFSSPFGGAKSGGDISLQVDMYNGDASIINRSVGNALLNTETDQVQEFLEVQIFLNILDMT